MPTEYNEKVLEHFFEPHNVGVIERADGVGLLVDLPCAGIFVMFIRVFEGRVEEIKYLVQGCGAAIATCSALSDIVRGKTLEAALRVTDEDISAELGGLSLEGLHCSCLAAIVLQKAIDDYRSGHKGGTPDWRSLYQRYRLGEGRVS